MATPEFAIEGDYDNNTPAISNRRLLIVYFV